MSASVTADWVALFRAAEASLSGDRSIYRDMESRQLVGTSAWRSVLVRPRLSAAALAAIDLMAPGLAGMALVRQRFFDELLEAMLGDGLDQVVVLGAGYDGTGLRLARGGSSAVVYEVDRHETQDHKRALLAKIDADAVGRTAFVECDFICDSVGERLTAAGLSPDRRTLFSWLGVSWYLAPTAVDSLLADLAAVAAPGSRIVFDYAHADVLSGRSRAPGARLAGRVAAIGGEKWTFGMEPDEVRDRLAGHGWSMIQNVPASELRDRYQVTHNGRLRLAAAWVSVVEAVRREG